MNIKNFLILIASILTLSAQSQSVKLNEIMYNFGYNIDKLEAGNWVELYNTTNMPVNLKDWQIKFGDAVYVAPNYTLGANDYVLVTSKDSLMKANYPGLSLKILGDTILGGLDDNSEKIEILNAGGTVVDSLTYFDAAPWPKCADGDGQSLSLTNTNANNNNASNWVCSGVLGGTPGMPNTNNVCTYTPPKVIVNEINYKSSILNNGLNDADDWIEFYNASANAIDMSNWTLYDTDSIYIFPSSASDNTIINPSDYLVLSSLTSKLIGVHPGVSNFINTSSFMSLSGDGEAITLVDDNNCLVHRVRYNDSEPWPISPDGDGPTLSLINESYNNKVAGSWAPSTAGSKPFGTPGQPNNIPDPCAGNAPENLVINEINYNSSAGENPSNWIELFNAGNTAIDLSRYKVNNEGEQYIIPDGQMLNKGEYIVLVDSAAQFSFVQECPNSAFLNVDTELNFSNDGELVTIYNYKTQDYGCLVDSVRYNDNNPWPLSPDGGGYTLELLNPNSDNSDPANWAASTFTLGSPGMPNQQANPIICNCDFNKFNYFSNAPFFGDSIVNARDSLDFTGNNTYFDPGSNTKFYAGINIEIDPISEFNVGSSASVLFDIDACQ